MISKVRGGRETAMRAHPGSTPGAAQNVLLFLAMHFLRCNVISLSFPHLAQHIHASAKVAKSFGRHRESNPGVRAWQFLGLRALSRAFFDPGKKLKSLDLPRVRVT